MIRHGDGRRHGHRRRGGGDHRAHHRGFQNMKALSTRNDSRRRPAGRSTRSATASCWATGRRWWCSRSLEHAERRGATILGEVVGYGVTGDAYHITAPGPDGEGAQRAMRAASRTAGIDPSDVDYINAHGTSTPLGDIAETQAVKAVFGEHAGRLVFGSDQVDDRAPARRRRRARVRGLAARGATGKIPPTINQFNPDPDCDLALPLRNAPPPSRAEEIRAFGPAGGPRAGRRLASRKSLFDPSHSRRALPPSGRRADPAQVVSHSGQAGHRTLRGGALDPNPPTPVSPVEGGQVGCTSPTSRISPGRTRPPRITATPSGCGWPSRV